jgi:hypothetical protein
MSGIVLSFIAVAQAGGVIVMEDGTFSGAPFISTPFGG